MYVEWQQQRFSSRKKIIVRTYARWLHALQYILRYALQWLVATNKKMNAKCWKGWWDVEISDVCDAKTDAIINANKRELVNLHRRRIKFIWMSRICKHATNMHYHIMKFEDYCGGSLVLQCAFSPADSGYTFTIFTKESTTFTHISKWEQWLFCNLSKLIIATISNHNRINTRWARRMSRFRLNNN